MPLANSLSMASSRALLGSPPSLGPLDSTKKNSKDKTLTPSSADRSTSLTMTPRQRAVSQNQKLNEIFGQKTPDTPSKRVRSIIIGPDGSPLQHVELPAIDYSSIPGGYDAPVIGVLAAKTPLPGLTLSRADVQGISASKPLDLFDTPIHTVRANGLAGHNGKVHSAVGLEDNSLDYEDRHSESSGSLKGSPDSRLWVDDYPAQTLSGEQAKSALSKVQTAKREELIWKARGSSLGYRNTPYFIEGTPRGEDLAMKRSSSGNQRAASNASNLGVIAEDSITCPDPNSPFLPVTPISSLAYTDRSPKGSVMHGKIQGLKLTDRIRSFKSYGDLLKSNRPRPLSTVGVRHDARKVVVTPGGHIRGLTPIPSVGVRHDARKVVVTPRGHIRGLTPAGKTLDSGGSCVEAKGSVAAAPGRILFQDHMRKQKGPAGNAPHPLVETSSLLEELHLFDQLQYNYNFASYEFFHPKLSTFQQVRIAAQQADMAIVAQQQEDTMDSKKKSETVTGNMDTRPPVPEKDDIALLIALKIKELEALKVQQAKMSGQTHQLKHAGSGGKNGATTSGTRVIGRGEDGVQVCAHSVHEHLVAPGVVHGTAQLGTFHRAKLVDIPARKSKPKADENSEANKEYRKMIGRVTDKKNRERMEELHRTMMDCDLRAETAEEEIARYDIEIRVHNQYLSALDGIYDDLLHIKQAQDDRRAHDGALLAASGAANRGDAIADEELMSTVEGRSEDGLSTEDVESCQEKEVEKKEEASVGQ